ncbi:MAG TPA: EamA family transporter [Candidatus Saccharimonadales bacterium]|nr:EamA family transporter [Candidatus Saccharimonadales bacterium]
MNWIFFAILAPALWAITNLFDKYLLEKHIPNINVYLFFTGSIGLVVLFGIPFFGFVLPPLHIIIAGLVAGALFNYQMFPYFKALTIEEASRVVPIYQLSSIFVLVISYLIIHEKLTFHEFIAFPLLVLGGFLVSIKRIEGIFTLSKALWFMIGAAFLYALHILLSKYLYLHITYYQGLVWISIGGFLSVLPLLLGKQTRKDVRLFFNKRPIIKGLMVGNELINLGAIVASQMALSTGPASLVAAFIGTQPFFVLLFTLITSIWFAKIVKEETKIHIVVHKMIALIITFVGVYFASQ